MKNLVIILLGLAPLISGAQNFVEGKVSAPTLDDHSKIAPLTGATVYWSRTTTGALTNIDGKFKLETTSETDTLVVSYIGYKTKAFRYNGEKFLDIQLEVGVELGVVDIEAERHSTEMSLLDPINTQTLDEKELCKAACCNLSESFETNASIDASFTDAVTGTRQIRMLGLDGKYSQILKDNIPLLRGLSTIYGLNYVPGPWIHSIQISKGVGSVTNGYESITGQINVAMKNPDNAEKLYVNAFANQAGRLELNANFKQKVNEHLTTTLLTHGEFLDQRWDNNGDGFIDAPLKKDVIIRNEWMLHTKRVFGSYQWTYLVQDQVSGQMGFQPNNEAIGVNWGAHILAERIEASAKTGYIFPEQDWKSFGSQLSFSQYALDTEFGEKQYDGFQRSFRANLLYQTRIVNEKHKIVGGVSYVQDEFEETLDEGSVVNDFSRVEKVPGAFVEYTWSRPELFALVAGIRGDQHNLYGTLVSPRLHFRYSLSENSSVKVGAGVGYRTPNIVMENVGLLASNRGWIIHGNANEANFGLPMEQAVNLGVNYLQKFRLFYRDASVSVDFYRTEFVNQLVVDLDQSSHEVNLYALDGKSYSNSAQVEFEWSPARRLTARMAYRWLDVKTQFMSGLLAKPLVANHRAFTNLAYETKAEEDGGQWRFDATVQWVGESRIPDTSMNPEEYQVASTSDDYVMLSAQVTKAWSEDFEVYLGGENLTNFRQPNPIISAEDPFGENFDASLIWAPVFGRMAYVGLRWKIK